MNYDIKYIYFELYSESVKGEEMKETKIQKENALMFKPHTNSQGIWGFTNITKSHRYRDKESYTHVHQLWIDLEKYRPYKLFVDGGELDRQVKQVLHTLNKKLRKPKLEKINSNI